MRISTLVLVLLVAGCTSSVDGTRFDLTLSSETGVELGTIRFTMEGETNCEALDCRDGYYDWTARDVTDDFPLDEASGVLYANRTGTGGYRLVMLPNIQDYGVTVSFDIDGDRAEGRWGEAGFQGVIAEGDVSGTVRD